VALSGLTDIWEISLLAHAPLLELLEEMAARSGFGWYKQRLRAQTGPVDPVEAVGPTTDQLPEKSFSHFKQALGNNERATKYWLSWAEEAGMIVKGFQLQCPTCHAKQWIPVAAFSPPIICRGCAEVMATPFGDRPNVNFMYRLSERLRRAYEHDAIGHLLTLQYFDSLFSRGRVSDLVGAHPGMEVRRNQGDKTEGEADVLLLFRNADFVPIEVKRSFSGVTTPEMQRLDHLAEQLQAPWSAVAVCGYGSGATEEFWHAKVGDSTLNIFD
jgi:ribosomal protein S27E